MSAHSLTHSLTKPISTSLRSMYPKVFDGETNRVTIAIHAMRNKKQAGVLYISSEQMSEVRNKMMKSAIEQNTLEMIIDDRSCMFSPLDTLQTQR